MSRNQRVGVIAAAAVLIGAAFVLLRPTEEADGPDAPPAPAAQSEAAPSTRMQRAEAKPRPPRVEEVRIRDGRAAEGARTLSFRSGETARIDFTTNAPSEIHLHGYDIERRVTPGKTTKVRFRADIEGIFELEDHDSGQELASVKVSPR